MKWKTLSGRLKDIPSHQYRVDFDGDQGSEFSAEVLDFFYPYWKYDVVFAEHPVPGTKMRWDFVNQTKRVILETDGDQHHDPQNHWNKIKPGAWLKQVKHDADKDKIAEKNGYTVVRIRECDLPLTKEWVQETFGIIL